jgi:hypothetical protein
MTAEQSPQVRGSLTGRAQTGQYNSVAVFLASGAGFGELSIITNTEQRSRIICTKL